MPLVSMRQLLDHAADHGYGLPAFNVNNLEQVQAIMAAAEETDSPVIMQASAGARKYAGETFLRHLIEAAVESYPKIPVVMHQDHGQSPDVCASAIRLGFTSVMMDGSLQADGKTIASYDYNLDVTRKVVDMAHALGVTVEGELGCLGSLETMRGDKEDGHGAEGTMTREMLLTDPDQAADFVKRTQLDALAIAIGTSHGAYKFSRKPRIDRSRSGTGHREKPQIAHDQFPANWFAGTDLDAQRPAVAGLHSGKRRKLVGGRLFLRPATATNARRARRHDQ